MRNENTMKHLFFRYMAVLLLAVLLLTATGCGKMPELSTPVSKQGTEESNAVSSEESTDELPEKAFVMPEELLVGNPNAARGDFFSDLFGSGGADQDVRALIHGYNLVNWDQEQGVYIVDPSVVYQYTTSKDAKGNVTYDFTLWDDLCYSDGTKITAKDYAFSYLLQMSPVVEEIGGRINRAEHILGYKEFLSGETKELAGVRVLGDYELSVTLNKAFLPYYYEEGLLLCNPYPISVIAPGCSVEDDGAGAYIAGDGFTAEQLRKTILDPATGYNSHPSVTSGAYTLVSYDGTTCHFALNPYFKGVWTADRMTGLAAEDKLVEITDGDGNKHTLLKPSIEKIAYTVVSSDALAEDFASGGLHLVNKVTRGEIIDELYESDTLDYDLYPREGLSFIAFSYELPTVREKAVRQAIAWCLDRDGIAEDYCGEYGMRVDGYYGIGQEEYMLASGEAAYPIKKGYDKTGKIVTPPEENEEKFPYLYARSDAEYKMMRKKWQALNLEDVTAYTVDTEKANKLLDKAGWTLNRDGGKYSAETDGVRCKKVDGELVALDLKIMVPEGSRIADALQRNAVENLASCGIRLTIVPAPAAELLSSYYRDTERTTDMLYLATNFSILVDPSITVSTEKKNAEYKLFNSLYTDDETLYKLSEEMRKTKPGDVYTHVKKWIAFQERFSEVLPAIPVYSNTYYDFYIPQLRNYNISSHATWTQAVIESYLSAD